MKASELIEKLQELIKEHGDKNVLHADINMTLHDINKVKFVKWEGTNEEEFMLKEQE